MFSEKKFNMLWVKKRLFDVNNYNDSVGYSLESLKIQIDSLDLLNAVLFKAKLNIDRLLP